MSTAWKPLRPARWRLTGALYLAALATAAFFALARCAGPDYAPAAALGAENKSPAPYFGGCEPPREPLYDTDGHYYGCGLPPAPEPRPAPERRDHASPF